MAGYAPLGDRQTETFVAGLGQTGIAARTAELDGGEILRAYVEQ